MIERITVYLTNTLFFKLKLLKTVQQKYKIIKIFAISYKKSYKTSFEYKKSLYKTTPKKIYEILIEQ